ncbi:hypothetical protein HDV00_003984 [Rhizophlyctis rosea]|nr:hypothetical protein HDV00_003984 [Rhizophlyctis rosea]
MDDTPAHTDVVNSLCAASSVINPPSTAESSTVLRTVMQDSSGSPTSNSEASAEHLEPASSASEATTPQSQIQALKNELQDYRIQHSLSSDLATMLRGRNEDLEKRIQMLTEELSTEKRESSNLTKRNEQLVTRLEAEEVERAELRQNVSYLRRKQMALERTVKDLEHIVDLQRQKAGADENAYSAAGWGLKELREKVDKLTDGLLGKTAECAELVVKVGVLEDDRSQLEKDVTEVTGKNEALRQEVTGLVKKVGVLEDDNIHLETDLMDAIGQNARKGSAPIAERDAKILALELELESARAATQSAEQRADVAHKGKELADAIARDMSRSYATVAKRDGRILALEIELEGMRVAVEAAERRAAKAHDGKAVADAIARDRSQKAHMWDSRAEAVEGMQNTVNVLRSTVNQMRSELAHRTIEAAETRAELGTMVVLWKKQHAENDLMGEHAYAIVDTSNGSETTTNDTVGANIIRSPPATTFPASPTSLPPPIVNEVPSPSHHITTTPTRDKARAELECLAVTLRPPSGTTPTVSPISPHAHPANEDPSPFHHVPLTPTPTDARAELECLAVTIRHHAADVQHLQDGATVMTGHLSHLHGQVDHLFRLADEFSRRLGGLEAEMEAVFDLPETSSVVSAVESISDIVEIPIEVTSSIALISRHCCASSSFLPE